MDRIDSESGAYILLGPPGSGKSTQAGTFVDAIDAAHIDMGSALRAAAALTPFGEKLSRTINEHRTLVGDDIVRSVLGDELRKIDASRPVVIDGAPRRESQIGIVLSAIRESGRELRAVVFIDLPEEVSVARISRRFSCSGCGRKFVLGADLPKGAAACPSCGGTVSRREDDTEAGVRKRFRVFRTETMPVIAYFEREGVLFRVSGDRPAEEISAEVRSIIH